MSTTLQNKLETNDIDNHCHFTQLPFWWKVSAETQIEDALGSLC